MRVDISCLGWRMRSLDTILELEAQVSLYRSPDINKPYYECLHVEYNLLFKPEPLN